MATAEETSLKLKVMEALPKDLGRGLARLDPADLASLGIAVGDVVTVIGKRATVVKAMPAYKDTRGQSRVQIDGVTRENAGASVDQIVELVKTSARPAQRVVLEPLGFRRRIATSSTSAASSMACRLSPATAFVPSSSAINRPISRWSRRPRGARLS